jgi:hypothetical protein
VVKEMSWLIPTAIGAGVVFFCLYVFLFIFLTGSSNQGRPYDKFIMDICSPKGDGDFFKTVFTFGYCKRTVKRFLQYYRLKFFPQPTAELHKPAPDATIVTLNGETRSLVRDYVEECQKLRIPLILNMGSYT